MTETEYQRFNSDNRAILDKQEKERREYEAELARMDGESLNGGDVRPINLHASNYTTVDIWY